MAGKGQYCEAGCGGKCEGYKTKVAMQMYQNRDVHTDPRDPGTRTEELYPLKQRAP